MSDKPNVRIWLSEQKRLESSAECCQRWCRRKLRWQAVPHLSASSRKCSAANGGAVNRRPDEAVAADRAKQLFSHQTRRVLGSDSRPVRIFFFPRVSLQRSSTSTKPSARRLCACASRCWGRTATRRDSATFSAGASEARTTTMIPSGRCSLSICYTVSTAWAKLSSGYGSPILLMLFLAVGGEGGEGKGTTTSWGLQ